MKRLVKWLCGNYRRAIRERDKLAANLAQALNEKDELHRRLLKAWSDECVRDCDLEDMHHALGSAGKAVEELQDDLKLKRATIYQLRKESQEHKDDLAALFETIRRVDDTRAKINEKNLELEETLRALSDSRNELVERLDRYRSWAWKDGGGEAIVADILAGGLSTAEQAMQTVAYTISQHPEKYADHARKSSVARDAARDNLERLLIVLRSMAMAGEFEPLPHGAEFREMARVALGVDMHSQGMSDDKMKRAFYEKWGIELPELSPKQKQLMGGADK